jgi:SAM-dependent methyltransferase
VIASDDHELGDHEAHSQGSITRAQWDDEWTKHHPDDEGSADEVLVAEVSGLEPGRALELACGEGSSAVWLATQGWQMTAVDFSTVAVGRGRKAAAEAGVTVDFLVSDVLSYRPAGLFDLVMVFYLHLAGNQQADLIRKMSDLVAVGGTLLYVGHDPSDEDMTQMGLAVPGPDEIVGLLGGFEADRADIVPRRLSFDGETWDVRDVIVRARRLAE